MAGNKTAWLMARFFRPTSGDIDGADLYERWRARPLPGTLGRLAALGAWALAVGLAAGWLDAHWEAQAVARYVPLVEPNFWNDLLRPGAAGIPGAVALLALRWVRALLLVAPLYAELGMLNARLGAAHILAHDRIVQTWESAIFRGQPAYELIRRYPSVVASGLFHFAYFSYYAILIGGPVLLGLACRTAPAPRVLLATLPAFLACYTPLTLWAVARSIFPIPHPTGGASYA